MFWGKRRQGRGLGKRGHDIVVLTASWTDGRLIPYPALDARRRGPVRACREMPPAPQRHLPWEDPRGRAQKFDSTTGQAVPVTHFTDEQAEAQRGEGTCRRPLSPWTARLGADTASVPTFPCHRSTFHHHLCPLRLFGAW